MLQISLPIATSREPYPRMGRTGPFHGVLAVSFGLICFTSIMLSVEVSNSVVHKISFWYPSSYSKNGKDLVGLDCVHVKRCHATK